MFYLISSLEELGIWSSEILYCFAVFENKTCRQWKFCVGMCCFFLKLDESQAKFKV